MLSQETNLQSQENWLNFNICYSVSAHKGYFKTMASMTMGNLGQAYVKVKHYILLFYMQLGFPGGSDGKESACSTVDEVHPWVGKIPWRREWPSLQCSCLENSMDKGAWRATVHEVAERWTQLSK